ncbi:MAG TPA: hypothetical protein VF911_19205 [Thermoanaerobaculia bacterium]|jgi:hypothetical protein
MKLHCIGLAAALAATSIQAQDVIPVEQPSTTIAPQATATAPEAATAWPQEPTGFAGLPFGASKEEVQTRFKVPCQPRKVSKPGDVSFTCKQPHYSITDDIAVEATFKLVNNAAGTPEFHGVELEITNRRFSKVKALLIEKYGPPMVSDARRKTADVLMLGIAAQNTQYHTWLGQKAKISITEPPQPLARSIVVIERRVADAKANENL